MQDIIPWRGTIAVHFREEVPVERRDEIVRNFRLSYLGPCDGTFPVALINVPPGEDDVFAGKFNSLDEVELARA